MHRFSTFVTQIHPRSIALCAPAVALCAASASAQITVFSIDWHSPTVGVPDSFTGTPITEGDILAANTLIPALGPLPVPGILETAGLAAPIGLGLPTYPGCVGHPGGTPCRVEVDALSFGLDARPRSPAGTVGMPGFWAFSVRFRGVGFVGTPLAPAVWTEGPCQDEAADVFVDLGLPPGPLPPFASPPSNTGQYDGNGLPSCSGAVYPGFGLRENPPGTVPGDNLDALDEDVPDRFLPRSTCTYFSLDSAFIDPVTGFPNSGSAAANGFVGGDVLMTPPPTPSVPLPAAAVYATALQLGLDLFGPDTDDLDGLALAENGVPGYQRSTNPYDWASGATDMLFFSVRRGSRIIGTPDAFFGIPISEGDILTPTGPLGSPPGIWIAAENIGLATIRSGVANRNDDLDGLDTLHEPQPGVGFCAGDGSGTACPCGNFGATGRGCANSENPFGALLWGNGNPSVSSDRLLLTCSGLPNTAPCLLFQGTTSLGGGVVFGDGLRCVGGSVRRLYIRTALCGNREFGYTVPGDAPLSVTGAIPPGGGTRFYQVWYRNVAAFCTPFLYNLTNGYRVTWVP